MKKRWLFAGVVVVLAASLLLPACAKEEVGPTEENTLIIGVSQILKEAFDPFTSPTYNKTFLTLVYDCLVGHTRDGQLSTETGIASKWEVTPDGKTWTFWLREGIKFHNGDELTAEDVKFQIDRLFDPDTVAYGASSVIDIIGSPENIEVVDPYKLVIHGAEPNILLPETLSELSGTLGMIAPKGYFEEVGIDYFSTHPIGSGPYRMKEFVSGTYILLEAAFDEHWLLGKPKYKYVKLVLIPDEAARIGMLKRDELDITPVSLQKKAELEAAGVRTTVDPYNDAFVLKYDTVWDTQYPVSDIRVREAIALAIDRKTISEQIWAGTGIPTGHGVTGPICFGYKPIDPVPYDPERARQLLAEAGYPDGFELKLHAFQAAQYPEFVPTAEAIVDYLADVGIKAEIILYPDWGTFWPLLADGGTALEGGIHLSYYNQRVASLLISSWAYHSEGGGSQVKDPELDALYDRALKATIREERAQLVHEIELYLRDHFHVVGFHFNSGLLAIGDRIPDGWDGGAVGADWNLKELLFEEEGLTHYLSK